MSGNRFEHQYAWILAIEDEESRKNELSSLLERSGFSYGQRSATNLLLLSEKIPPAILFRVSLASLHTSSPDMALNGLERIASVLELDLLLKVLENRQHLTRLMTICGASPFLTNLICREPSLFSQLFVDERIGQSCSQHQLLTLLRQRMAEQPGLPGQMQVLRRFKRAEILRIAARDLNGLATLEETTAELSALATATLQAAFEGAMQIMVKEHGEPLKEGGGVAEMAILGMGKLGGEELNFSSDIDLIYFYETDRGETAGIDDGRGGRKGVITLHSFFNKLAELITKSINQVTEDGFVFRVDLGLRPEGGSGDLAISIRSAEVYYESWGQSWERTAMLKGRPVAGSIRVGEQLLQAISPFIYRKYLDYTLIEDMKLMKQKIDASLTRNREGETNLKLGRGGIREIEFFIQALQLVHAGKMPALRERNSLKALQLLAEAKVITADDMRQLTDAYRFLRTTEHRIQVVQERQTHNLPAKGEELLALARRCGFLRGNGLTRFSETLERHRLNVSAIYNSLFHTPEEKAAEGVEPEILYLLDIRADQDLVKDMLAERKLEDVDRAFENLSLLRNGPRRRNVTERGRRIHARIAPRFLQELLNSPDPDMALGFAERFLSVISGRLTCYALLAENVSSTRLLANLFGTSAFLSKILINHPELLEGMVSLSYTSAIKPKNMMEQELNSLLQQGGDLEEYLDILRRYRNEEFLRIGLGDINGQAPQGVVAMQLTSLAEVLLAAAYRLAIAELSRFGEPGYMQDGERLKADMAVVGMGKLGGGELNYHSDLDIIFIYDRQGYTDGVKQITNHEYFAKLAQKLIMILSTVTREGYVYKLDTRLRPSGNAGPLVTSLEAFAEYQRTEAQLWERQALAKGRVVFGGDQLRSSINQVVSGVVYGSGLNQDGAAEINRLRMRMENEIARESSGSYNIKTGRGGMVDVEFIAQYLQLCYGCSHPELQVTRTVDLVSSAGRLGLLSETDAATLVSGYKFLRKLENRLRLLHDNSINALSGDAAYLDKLARRLGYDQKLRHPGELLMTDYMRITDSIRKVYQQVFSNQEGTE